MNCINRNLGCKFTGTPKEFLKHIENECEKIKVKCPLKNCNLSFYKDEIDFQLIDCITLTVEIQVSPNYSFL